MTTTTATRPVLGEFPDLWEMTPRARRIWADAYGLGYQHGVTREHQRMENVLHEELRELGLCFCLSDAEVRAVYRAVANSPSYAELLERRGQPEEAARYRNMLRARGLGDVA